MEKTENGRPKQLKMIADTLGTSVPALKREIRKGNLKAYRFGGRLYVYTEDLAAYMDAAAVRAQQGV